MSSKHFTDPATKPAKKLEIEQLSLAYGIPAYDKKPRMYELMNGRRTSVTMSKSLYKPTSYYDTDWRCDHEE